MEVSLFAAVLLALALAAPLLVSAYIQRLPVAPACPTCRAVTRHSDRHWIAVQLFSVLPATFVGECTRCGWRGRMRWRWATRPVKRRGPG